MKLELFLLPVIHLKDLMDNVATFGSCIYTKYSVIICLATSLLVLLCINVLVSNESVHTYLAV